MNEAVQAGRGVSMLPYRPWRTLLAALLTVALSLAMLVLLRRLLGWLLPEGTGSGLFLIRGVSHAAPLVEVVGNAIPAFFAGVVGLMLATELLAPHRRIAAIAAVILIWAVLLVAHLSAPGLQGGTLGTFGLAFGLAFGCLLPAIR